MLLKDQKVFFDSSKCDYKTDITLTQFAKHFKYFEDLILEYGDTDSPVEYFKIECNLEEDDITHLINILFRVVSVYDRDPLKLLYFVLKYDIKNYDRFFSKVPICSDVFKYCIIDENKIIHKDKNYYKILFNGIVICYLTKIEYKLCIRSNYTTNCDYRPINPLCILHASEENKIILRKINFTI